MNLTPNVATLHAHMPASAPPWWVEKLLVPAFFTLVGAALGVVIAELREKLQARRSKKAFLAAIGLELDAVKAQLDATNQAVDESLDKLQRGGGPPQFAGVTRRTVFTSQLSKLHDVADQLVVDVILFYSDIGILEQIIGGLNQASVELAKITSDVHRATAQSRLKSTLMVLREQSTSFQARIAALRVKLPPRQAL